MRNFTVKVEEAESLDCLINGKWERRYASGVGFAMNRSPKRAYQLAQQRMRRNLADNADNNGFQGIGGTPILRCVTVERDGKVILRDY